MEQILTQQTTPNEIKDTKNNSLLTVLIILMSLVLVSIGILIGLNLSSSSKQAPTNDPSVSQIPTTLPTPVDTIIPTAQPTLTSTPIHSTPTPEPTAVVNEVTLVRKLIANFEKFNATKNIAGCLNFFTPAITSGDKAKLSQIRSTNLPYTISSWMFGASDDRYLLNKKSDNLYQVIMVETRDGVSTNIIVEVTRVGDEFLIDRYYEAGQTSGNLKYQGFKL